MVEALVKDKIMKFEKSGSPDVVGYVLYMELMPNLATRASFKAFMGMPPVDPADGKMYINLAELENIPTTDGRYNLAVTAFDEVGNESSFSEVHDVPLDFDAPDAPGEITIVSALG